MYSANYSTRGNRGPTLWETLLWHHLGGKGFEGGLPRQRCWTGWELPGIRQAEPVGEGLASEAPGTGKCDIRGPGLSGLGEREWIWVCLGNVWVVMRTVRPWSLEVSWGAKEGAGRAEEQRSRRGQWWTGGVMEMGSVGCRSARG